METVNERGIELMSLALEARVTNKILEIRGRFNKEQRIERNEIRRFWESSFFEDRHWFLSIFKPVITDESYVHFGQERYVESEKWVI